MPRNSSLFSLVCQRVIRSSLQALASVGLMVVCSSALMAQLPTPKLSSIFPPGGKLGSAIEVKVTGSDQDDPVKLIFSHEGITAKVKMTAATEYQQARPVAGQFTVTIGPKVPPGVYEARLSSRFGVSNPRAFVVGLETETNEVGGNALRDKASEFTIGSVINGRADASNVDYYKLTLKQGQRVLIECWAQRIDSRMDATLVLYDSTGKELARDRDSIGMDPLLDFTAPAAGTYTVGLYDFIYGGGADFFYRLHMHSRPHIDFIFPPSASSGSKQHFTLYGRNLPGGETVKGLTVGGASLQKRVVAVDMPADEASLLQAPMGALVEPRGVLLDGLEYRLANSNPITIGFAMAPVVIEHEPNNEPAMAQQVSIPCEYVGQFFPSRDNDWIQFDATKGEVYWIEVISHRLGLDCDPYIILQRITTDAQGVETATAVAQIDDPADRSKSIGSNFDTSTDDPSYRFSASADGTYRIRIRDQFASADPDPRNVYRLVIRRDHPDFRLLALPVSSTAPAANQILQTSTVLRRGGTEMIEVRIDRRDGFTGDVSLSLEGLPTGVTCSAAVLRGSTKSIRLIVVSDEKAAAWSGAIRVVGKAQINSKEVVRHARAGSVVWGTANRTTTPAAFRATRDFFLSVTGKELAPAMVQADSSKLWETSLGGNLEIPIKVTRRGAFKLDLKLSAIGLPKDIKPAAITVKGADAEGKFVIAINNTKSKPGLYSFYLTSTAKVKYSRNPDAIQLAQQEQKLVDEAIKNLTAQSKSVAAEQAAATKAAQEADQAVKATTQAKGTSATAKTAADAAAKIASDQLASVQKELAKEPQNQDLTEALKKAQQAKQEADAKANAASQKLTSDTKALADAQAKVKAAAQAKIDSAKRIAELAAKLKSAQAAKKPADARLAAAKKANAPKDLNVTFISTPINFSVVASPISVEPLTAPGALSQSSKIVIPLTIDRQYGFDDKVDLTLELPKGVTGFSAAKLSIPKGQSTGNLEITAANTATVGNHTLTIRAKAAFNKINVQAVQQLVLKVEKATAAAK